MFYWLSLLPIIFSASFIMKKYIFIIWMLLTVISGLRFNVGTDYRAYAQMFIELVNGTANDIWLNKEIGYLWLVDIVNFFGGNYQLVFFLMSVSITTFFYKGLVYFFKGNQTYLLLSTLLFIPIFYFLSMNIIRQALVAAIFLYSIKFIIQKNFFKYLFVILIATMFHKSAIILFPLYWLLNMRYSNNILLFYFLFGISLVIANPIEIMIDMLYSSKIFYISYLRSDDYNIQSSLFSISITYLSTLLTLSLLLLLNRENKKENILFNSMIFFVLLRLLAIDIDILNRLSFYFKPFFIIFIIFVVSKISKKIKNTKNILFVLLITLTLAYSIISIYSRALIDGSYNQYALNLCLFGEPCPLQIYGDYNNLYFKE